MKLSISVLLLIMLTALAGCDAGKPDSGRLTLMEASRRELASAVEERDQLLGLVKEISQGMNRIKQLEDQMAAVDIPREKPVNKAQILRDLAEVKSIVRQRREQLEALESRLHESVLFTDVLQETIDALRVQIDSQTAEIESLRLQLSDAREHIGSLAVRVDSLSSTVEAVENERDSVQAASSNLEVELNRVYYVIASKSELKNHRIIESSFLKPVRVMKKDFDRNFFKVADRRVLTEIPLGSSKARILTNHPAGSWHIEDGTLRITDPALFWSLTDYLVIISN